jgi:hypothetical protein
MGRGWIRMAALTAAAGLAAAGMAVLPAGAATAKVRVTITGIDPDGASVGVYGSIYPVAGATKLLRPGQAVHVLPGTYWFGASVPTESSGITAQQTLVMRRVTIRRSEAVTLSAKAGTPVSLRLAGATATSTDDFLEACVNGIFVSGAASPAGTLYAVPVKARSMQISYATTWEGASASYAMAGRTSGGIPGQVSHTIRPARMAKINMVLYGGVADTYQGTSLVSGGLGCDKQVLGLQENPVPGSALVYLTPGTWSPTAYSDAVNWQSTHRYLAGHSYTDRFGTAVAGPKKGFPVQVFPGALKYQAGNNLFADPVQSTGLCTVCARFKLALWRGSQLVAHTRWIEHGSGVPFGRTLHRAGWYTLRVEGRRNPCCGPTPPWLLSPAVSVRWRFLVTRLQDGARPLAATTTQYRPQGLNIDNEATPGASTRLLISVIRARGGYLNHGAYNVKMITVRASFDSGKTWHKLELTRLGSGWTTTVHDPLSGFVTLRSTVTDGSGDSTVQTIDKAYGIS